MAFTTVYKTDVDISLVIFFVETIIGAMVFLIGLLEPKRELREIFEYRTVKKQGYVRIRGHSYVPPPFLFHFFTLGVAHAILVLLITIGMMGCGMVGAFVATDSQETLLESRAWKTCKVWAGEDSSDKLFQGLDFANFVCANFSSGESSGVFFDGEQLRCSDLKFEHRAEHCTVLRNDNNNCEEEPKLKDVHEAINNGGFFRITELRSWKESALLSTDSSRVWAELGTNTTVFGKELVLTCKLLGLEDPDSSFLPSTDFRDCFFSTGGVYFFTGVFARRVQRTPSPVPSSLPSTTPNPQNSITPNPFAPNPFVRRDFVSIEERIQDLVVSAGLAVEAAATGTLVDIGQVADHTTLTNIDARLAVPNGFDARVHTFRKGQVMFHEFLSVALCFSRQSEAVELLSRSNIEVRWWVVVIIVCILGLLLVVAMASKLVIRRHEFRISTPSGREADRYVDDVLKKKGCDEPHVNNEVMGVIQKTDHDHVGVAADKHAKVFGRRRELNLR